MAKAGLEDTALGFFRGADPIIPAEYKRMNTGRILETFHVLQHARFALSSAAEHYFPKMPWKMMPDLAAIANGDARSGLLIASHFRANGHALGSVVTKLCMPAGDTERCPSCLMHIPDDPPHAIFGCQAPPLAEVREHHFAAFVHHASRHCPSWRKLWLALQHTNQRTALILHAPSFISNPTLKAELSCLLRSWLHAIADAHPTYHRYKKHTPIFAMDYYGGYDADESCDDDDASPAPHVGVGGSAV
jgi:hypothetical protein